LKTINITNLKPITNVTYTKEVDEAVIR